MQYIYLNFSRNFTSTNKLRLITTIINIVIAIDKPRSICFIQICKYCGMAGLSVVKIIFYLLRDTICHYAAAINLLDTNVKCCLHLYLFVVCIYHRKSRCNWINIKNVHIITNAQYRKVRVWRAREKLIARIHQLIIHTRAIWNTLSNKLTTIPR